MNREDSRKAYLGQLRATGFRSWKRANQRRGDLLYRGVRCSPEERAELQELQKLADLYLTMNWAEAEEKIDELAYERPRRLFVLGELWAGSEGMECRAKGCRRRTFCVFLTEKEWKSLPAPRSGSAAALKICQEKLGIIRCPEHAPKKRIDIVPAG